MVDLLFNSLALNYQNAKKKICNHPSKKKRRRNEKEKEKVIFLIKLAKEEEKEEKKTIEMLLFVFLQYYIYNITQGWMTNI